MSEQRMGATNGQGPAQDPFDEEDFGTFMKSMVDETRTYLGAQRDYYALLAADRAAKVAGATVSYVVLAVLAGTVLVFLSIAGALWLGRLTGNMALGFLLMGGFYLLVLLVLLFLWRGGMRERFTLDLINTMHDGPK